jgi:cytochrome c peroxidase
VALIRPALFLLCGWLGVASCAAAGHAAEAGAGLTRAEAYRLAAALTELGRAMFSDPTLSSSGAVACASCHDPARAFGPPNDRAVQLGGRDLAQPGLRAVPSLTYIQVTPQFAEHYYESEDDGDPSVDAGPTGGLTWDGRADRASDQARIPLLSPFEMANDSAAEVVAKVRRAPYADRLRQAFGNRIFDDPDAAFAAILKAFEAYEQSWREFYPYSSKYDAYLAGEAQLSEAEARGLALFDDERKGNCASCHPSGRGGDGTPPQFTDAGLVALGVPRNPAIPANADPAFHDLGLCGPLRTDFSGRAEYCGRFRTPSLRNVALRPVFFHNGFSHTLREAVAFYVERDTMPEKWFPRDADGAVRKYDDLPAAYRVNVNTDPPFGGKPGDRPALSDAEIDDVVAFLRTLTDGYRPQQ